MRPLSQLTAAAEVRIAITRRSARRLCAAVLFALAAGASSPAYVQEQFSPECRRALHSPDLFRDANLLRAIGRCLADKMPPGDPTLGEKLMEVEPPVIATLRDIVRLIFGLYQKKRPIGIARTRTQSGTGEINRAARICLVLLSGAEPTVFDQATTLADSIRAAILATEDDDFFYAVMLAIGGAIEKGYCDRDAQFVLAGHSLGGMEAQSVAAALVRQGLSVRNVLTFGAPMTAALPARVSVQRFATIGDPIPFATHFTGTYRDVRQLIVDDREGPGRLRAIEDAARERTIALGWISSPGGTRAGEALPFFVKWIGGALTAHLRYPRIRELERYDPLGALAGNGVTTALVIDRQTAIDNRVVGLIHTFPAPRLRRAPR
jgi:hypothetical protein